VENAAENLESPSQLVQEALKQLWTFDGVYKKDAIEVILVQREEATPYLIRWLEDVKENAEKLGEDENLFGPIYAILLLGFFRESRAHKLIVDIFSLPDKATRPIFGEIVTEDLSALLYRTRGESFELIKSLAEDRSADQYARSEAIRAYWLGFIDGVLTRDETISYFTSLFDRAYAEPYSFYWNELACVICDMYPEELMSLIEKAYQDGLIDTGCIGYGAFKEALKKGSEAVLGESHKQRDWYDLNDNFHTNLENWACFRKDDYELSGGSNYDSAEPSLIPPLLTSNIRKNKDKRMKRIRKVTKKARRKNRSRKK